MMALPAAVPVTRPVVGFTVALALDVIHEPTTDGSNNVIAAPVHTCMTPVIAEGRGLTVITELVLHPAPNE